MIFLQILQLISVFQQIRELISDIGIKELPDAKGLGFVLVSILGAIVLFAAGLIILRRGKPAKKTSS